MSGIDFFELAHRRDDRRLFFGRHDGRREVVGGGAEDRGLGLRSRVSAALSSRPSVSCSTAFISSATWRMDGGRSRPCFASSHETSSSSRGGIGLTGLRRGTGSVAILRRVEGRVERRVTREQLVGQRAEAVDVVRGPRRLAAPAAADSPRTANPADRRCCRLRTRPRRNPRAAVGRRRRAARSTA